MTEQVVIYSVTEAHIGELRDKYAALDATTATGYEEVRQAIALVRTTRVAIEKRRVELKADALEYGRKVDAVAKTLTALIASVEDPLVEKKKCIDDEKARIKAVEDAAKIAKVEAEIAANRAAEDARLKAIRDAEEARLAEERAALAAERAALAEDRRIESERAAAARQVEDARVLAQRERDQAERDVETVRLRVEREVIERERAAVTAQRIADEKAEAVRQAAIRAIDDAKAKAESERLAKAERDALIAALLPDTKKLEAFAAALVAVPVPTVKTKIAKAVLTSAVNQIHDIAEDLSQVGVR